MLNPEEHSNPELFAKMRNNWESVFIFAKCSIVLLGSQYTPEIIFKVIHKIELMRYRQPWTIYSQIYYETSNFLSHQKVGPNFFLTHIFQGFHFWNINRKYEIMINVCSKLWESMISWATKLWNNPQSTSKTMDNPVTEDHLPTHL